MRAFLAHLDRVRALPGRGAGRHGLDQPDGAGLERAEIEARRQAAEARREAALEENVRLALWRMDFGAGAAGRPGERPAVFRLQHVPCRRAGRTGGCSTTATGGEMAGPLAAVERARRPTCWSTSSSSPTAGSLRRACPSRRTSTWPCPSTSAEEARPRGEAAAGPRGGDRRSGQAAGDAAGDRPPSRSRWSSRRWRRVDRAAPDEQRSTSRRSQQRRPESAEFERRSQAVEQSTNAMVHNTGPDQLNCRTSPWSPPTDVGGVLMTPLWIDGKLLLARRVRVGRQEYVQGCLLDWPAIEERLLMAIEDLLARGRPACRSPTDAAEEESRRLAALPVRLIPGQSGGISRAGPATERSRFSSPIRLSLLVAWALRAAGGRGRGRAAGGRDAAERAPGGLRLGRHPRAAHAADHLPHVHRDAGRGDGARRERAAAST